jgi:hypothetical protein
MAAIGVALAGYVWASASSGCQRCRVPSRPSVLLPHSQCLASAFARATRRTGSRRRPICLGRPLSGRVDAQRAGDLPDVASPETG